MSALGDTVSLIGQFVRRFVARHAVLIVPMLAFGTAVHAWFQPGLIAGADFHAPALSTMDEMRRFFPWPSAWDPTTFVGRSLQMWMPYFPVWSLAGLLTQHGLTWSVVERALWLFPIFALFVFAAYRCFLSLSGTPAAGAAGATVFSLNTWTIGLIQRGHIPSLVAYGWFPVILLALVRYVREPTRFGAVLLGITLWLPMAYDLRYGVLALWMTVPVLLVLFVQRLRSGEAWRTVVADAVCFGACYFGANAYWVVPSILAPPALPQQYVAVSAFTSMSSFESWTTAIAAYFPFYHHMAGNNAFQPDLPSPGFFVVTLCFFAGIVLNWDRRLSRWCFTVWLVAVIFESGAGSLFSGLNDALFRMMPTLSLFRDVSKILSVCTFMMAIGVSLLVATTQRLSFHKLPIGSLVLIFGAIGYVATMRDAYSPYRFASFAISAPSGDKIALLDYLKSRPSGRVLYMPTTDEVEPGTDAHPSATVSSTSMFGVPNGVGGISPDEESMFGLLRSPLAGNLLCGLGVRYVVATYDSRGLLYTPWEVNYQYHEGLAFLRERTYLREVPGVSRDVPFEVLGCDPAPFAYAAPLPLAFIGAANQLEALAGTPFWNQRAGIVVAEDISNPEVLRSFENVIVGAFPVDPAIRAYAGPLSALMPQWGAAARSAGYEPRAYRGFLASRLGSSPTFRYKDALPYLNARFVDPYSGTADVLMVASPRRSPRGVIARRAFSTTSKISAAPLLNDELLWDAGAPSASLDTPASSAHLWRSSGEWVELSSIPLDFAIHNPGPTAVRANVVFPGFVSLGASTSDVSVRLVGQGYSERTVHAASRYLFDALGIKSSLLLNDLILQPGTTLVRVSQAGVSGSRVGVDRRVEITNVENIAQYVAPRRLDVSVVPAAQGVEFVPAATGTENAAHAPFRLLDGLRVELSKHPVVALRYVAPPYPLSLSLSFELRRSDGRKAVYTTSLPSGGTVYEAQLFKAVQDSLVAGDDRLKMEHEADIGWNVAHRLHPYPEASAYMLEAVDVVIVKRAGAAADPTQLARIHDVSVSVGETPVFNGPGEVNYRYADMRATHPEKSSSPLQTLHVSRSSSTADRLDLAFVLPASPQAAVPDHFSVGDTVAVNLTNGTAVSGVVFRTGPDVVVIHTSDGTMTGIELRNIASISSVMTAPAQRLSLLMPINTASDRAELSYDVAADASVIVHPSLEIKDSATGRTAWVAPLDRPDLRHAEHGMPADWVATLPDPMRSDPAPLGQPILFPHVSPQSYQRVTLPVDDIAAYELPAFRNPVLQALRLTIEASGTPTVGETVASVSIANVETHRFDSGASRELDRRSIDLVKIDGHAPEFSDLSTQRSELLEASGKIDLTGVEHTIRSQEHGSLGVDAVLVSQGAAHVHQGADAIDGRRLSDSEWTCSIDADSGLLVWPQLYDSGWSAALLTASDPNPTGNILVDAWRSRERLIQNARHLPVNGGLNGWLVPRVHGRVIFFYLPTLYAVLAAPAGFGLVVALLIFAYFVKPRRGRKALKA